MPCISTICLLEMKPLWSFSLHLNRECISKIESERFVSWKMEKVCLLWTSRMMVSSLGDALPVEGIISISMQMVMQSHVYLFTILVQI